MLVQEGMPHARMLMAAGLALFSVPPSLGARPWQAVRSVPAQSAAVAERHQRPIHYPHRASTPAGEPEPADRLLREFLDLHTAMRYEEAADVARRAVAAEPADPTGHYNLACVLSRLHRVDEAVEHLEWAIDCGWRDAVHLVLDPDLAAARRTARYPALLEELRRLVAAEAAAGTPPDPAVTAGSGLPIARPVEAPPAHL